MQNGTKTILPEGQELLQGLYLVQSYLERSNEKQTEYWQIEKQFRSSIAHIGSIQHIPYIRASEQKSLYGLFVAGIAFSLISAVAALFSGNMSTVLFGIICVVIFAIGRTKENKTLLTIGIVCIALMLFAWITGMMRSAAYFHSIGNDTTIIFSAGIQIVGLVVAVIVSGLLLKKYNAGVSRKNSIIDAQNQEIARKNQEIDRQNRQIAQHNLVIDHQRKQCMVELTAITREMVDETEWWFPADYYALDAIEQFISIVRNHRADTVKEMINTYIKDGFQNQVINNQETMHRQINQSLQNQQQMMKLQSKSNALISANLAANMATAANTSSIAASNQEIARNTAATAANTASSAASATRIADSVASAARDADAMARRVGAKW